MPIFFYTQNNSDNYFVYPGRNNTNLSFYWGFDFHTSGLLEIVDTHTSSYRILNAFSDTLTTYNKEGKAMLMKEETGIKQKETILKIGQSLLNIV